NTSMSRTRFTAQGASRCWRRFWRPGGCITPIIFSGNWKPVPAPICSGKLPACEGCWMNLKMRNAMSRVSRLTGVLLVLVCGGCAIHDARHEQCGRYSFTSCLGVTAQQCDVLFDRARETCQQ